MLGSDIGTLAVAFVPVAVTVVSDVQFVLKSELAPRTAYVTLAWAVNDRLNMPLATEPDVMVEGVITKTELVVITPTSVVPVVV